MPVEIACSGCGKSVLMPPSAAERRKHCSRACKAAAHKGKRRGYTLAEMMERIEANSIPIPFSGCWIWLGGLRSGGYGATSTHTGRGGGTAATHRISCEFHHGEPPPDTEVDHLCRVRGCWNPQHLEWVSRQVNILRGKVPEMLRERALRKSTATACRNGHLFTQENTMRTPEGTRRCAICRKASSDAANNRRTMK